MAMLHNSLCSTNTGQAFPQHSSILPVLQEMWGDHCHPSTRQWIYHKSLTETPQITPAFPATECSIASLNSVSFNAIINLASNTIRIQNLTGRIYSSTGNKTKSKFYWEIMIFCLFDTTATDPPFPATLCNHLTSLWHNLWWVLQISKNCCPLHDWCLLQLLMLPPFVPHQDWQPLLWIF